MDQKQLQDSYICDLLQTLIKHVDQMNGISSSLGLFIDAIKRIDAVLTPAQAETVPTLAPAPWYPDDGPWVEVPDDVMAFPAELFGKRIHVLLHVERAAMDYHQEDASVELFAEFCDWGMPPNDPNRIVAYRLADTIPSQPPTPASFQPQPPDEEIILALGRLAGRAEVSDRCLSDMADNHAKLLDRLEALAARVEALEQADKHQNERPWYPDDSGKWVEVPDWVTECKEEIRGRRISVLWNDERGSRNFEDAPGLAEDFDWNVIPGNFDRIVAYRIAEAQQ